MTNVECRKTKSEPISFHVTRPLSVWTAKEGAAAFVILVSSFFRHFAFVIRHSLRPHTPFNHTHLAGCAAGFIDAGAVAV